MGVFLVMYQPVRCMEDRNRLFSLLLKDFLPFSIRCGDFPLCLHSRHNLGFSRVATALRNLWLMKWVHFFSSHLPESLELNSNPILTKSQTQLCTEQQQLTNTEILWHTFWCWFHFQLHYIISFNRFLLLTFNSVLFDCIVCFCKW